MIDRNNDLSREDIVPEQEDEDTQAQTVADDALDNTGEDGLGDSEKDKSGIEDFDAPDLVDRLPGVPLGLLVAGGVLYSAGAVVYATRRPDPWPRTFGFHEVFHTLVILAAAARFAAMAGWVIPGGAGA